MDKLFLSTLNMSIVGAFVIIAICVARLPLKKAPKIISYCLWAVAGFRLIFPFSISGIISLIPFRSAPIPQDIATQAVPRIESGITVIDNAVSGVLPAAAPYHNANPLRLWTYIGASVWLTGAVVLLAYGVASYFLLKHKMRASELLEGNIYEAGNIQSPFLLGVMKPKIYIPTGLSDRDRDCVIRHERVHLRRRDYLVKFAAYFILCLHWFNPLAWLAFILMGADMEMSCDEQALKKMGKDMEKEIGAEAKRGYSLSLLSLATEKRSIGGSPLAFGEGGIKERVKNVLNFKKRSRIVITAAVVLAVALSVGFAVNRGGKTAGPAETPADITTGQTPADITGQLEQEVSKQIADKIMSETVNPPGTYMNTNGYEGPFYDQPKVTDQSFDGVTALNVTTIADNIIIKTGGDKTEVKYGEWMDNEYTLSVDGGTLTLTQNNTPYIQSASQTPIQTVEITVPADTKLGGVTLKTASGNIDIQQNVLTDALTANTASGNIGVSGCQAGTASIHTASGFASAANCAFAGDSSIDTASGRIDVVNSTFQNLDLHAASGSVNVNLAGLGDYFYRIVKNDKSGSFSYNGQKLTDITGINRYNAATTAAPPTITFSGPGSLIVNDSGPIADVNAETVTPTPAPDTLADSAAGTDFSDSGALYDGIVFNISPGDENMLQYTAAGGHDLTYNFNAKQDYKILFKL